MLAQIFVQEMRWVPKTYYGHSHYNPKQDKWSGA